MMDKIVLQSLKVLSDSSSYAAGVFKNNELHLTPIKSIMEMRPQFEYLETTDKQSKEDAKLAEGIFIILKKFSVFYINKINNFIIINKYLQIRKKNYNKLMFNLNDKQLILLKKEKRNHLDC